MSETVETPEIIEETPVETPTPVTLTVEETKEIVNNEAEAENEAEEVEEVKPKRTYVRKKPVPLDNLKKARAKKQEDKQELAKYRLREAVAVLETRKKNLINKAKIKGVVLDEEVDIYREANNKVPTPEVQQIKEVRAVETIKEVIKEEKKQLSLADLYL